MDYKPPSNGIKPFIRGTQKIGNTIFIDGSPHVECAHCGIPVKLHDSRKIVIGYWQKKEESLVIDPITNEGRIEIQHKPPVLKSTHGCAACSNRQLQEQQNQKGSRKPIIVFYNLNDCIGNKNGLTAGDLPRIRKKSWTVGIKSQKGFNTSVTR